MTKNNRRFLPSAVGFLLLLVSTHPSLAATSTVSNLADSGPGSLRQAVLAANAAAGTDEIVFTVTGTITLTSGEIAITDDLTIAGPGPGLLTVSGNDQSRTFRAEAPDFQPPVIVTLSGLTLTQGRAQGSTGGAVYASDANLTILRCVISDSEALLGGGLYISGVNVIRSSSILGNRSDSAGGGIHVSGGTLTIDSSTIAGNSAGSTVPFFGNGGGVDLSTVQAEVINSTISGNTASNLGGGMYFDSEGSGGSTSSFLHLRLTTISNNTAGVEGGNLIDVGGFFDDQIVLDHSIVANGMPDDISNDFAASYSLIEQNVAPGNNNIFGVDPLLGPLASNGGPTLTHLPLPGSPVIDAGNPAIPSPPPADQRGFSRIAGTAVDLGSVEAAAFAIDIPTLSEWGVFILSALLLAAGVWRLRAF